MLGIGVMWFIVLSVGVLFRAGVLVIEICLDLIRLSRIFGYYTCMFPFIDSIPGKKRRVRPSLCVKGSLTIMDICREKLYHTNTRNRTSNLLTYRGFL